MRLLTKAASTVFCAAAMTAMLSTGAFAQNNEYGMYNRTTTVTFSGPVEIPGVHLKGYAVLPAGTYVFKLMDSTTNRHIVQIFTKDQNKCIATIMAIPNTRVHLTDKTVITFRERPNGEPPALRAWYFPDAAWGEDFVYGKKEAKQLAQATKTPVLYNNSENEANNEVTQPIKPPTSAQVQQANQADVKAYSATGNEEELSQEVTPPAQTNNQMAQATPPQQPAQQTAPQPSQASTTPSNPPSQLPKTASPLGWIMLSGLLSLAGGLGIRLATKTCQ